MNADGCPAHGADDEWALVIVPKREHDRPPSAFAPVPDTAPLPVVPATAVHRLDHRPHLRRRRLPPTAADATSLK
jgi:hypothetical protein